MKKKLILAGTILAIFLMLVVPIASSMQINQQTTQPNEKSYNKPKDFGFHILKINVYFVDGKMVHPTSNICVNGVGRTRYHVWQGGATFTIVFTNIVDIKIDPNSTNREEFSQSFDLAGCGVVVNFEARIDGRIWIE